jgi:enoyl-CoA hydratase/carnithine racemase
MIELIRDKIEGVIATITLNNPEKLNALPLRSWKKLGETISLLSQNQVLRCIVLRGAGNKAFAAGADISEFKEKRSNSKQAIAYGKQVAVTLDQLIMCPIPIIAMISGICTGGGLEIACCCDIRISSQSGRFGVPIKNIGHAFAPSEMQPVLSLLGPGIILELLLEGQIWDAEQALKRGLVNRIVAEEKLEAEVYATANRIADGSPLAARMTKRVLRMLVAGKPFTQKELEESYKPCDSLDYQEGLRAFLAKEKPVFKGS